VQVSVLVGPVVSWSKLFGLSFGRGVWLSLMGGGGFTHLLLDMGGSVRGGHRYVMVCGSFIYHLSIG
jgi:hypothetical protein